MDENRPSTPEPPQDLWSSILDSVSSTRSIPAKNIVLLGEPSSGKSTIAAALLQKPPSDRDPEESKSDYALGYGFVDVRDDAEEDTLARLSVYTVPSSASSYTALLPHFLPPRTALPNSLAIITLDWTKPWTFVEELQKWLKWVDKWTKGDGSREVDIVREENHDRLQFYLQHYTEPSSDPIPVTSPLSNGTLPLGPGTLTHNHSGVPIIVTCTKADLIDEGGDLAAGASGMGGMVKGKGGEWEERTDGIMQVLRTICLKYGAALFYTTPTPITLQVLRQYALHLLFVPPAPSPASSNTDSTNLTRNPFPFRNKPNTLDRDQIVIPAGWDSWGKISIMRDGFDAKVWAEAWERDLEAEDQSGAKTLYSALVKDQGQKPHSLPPLHTPTPEQAFLAKNYDENAKKPDRDPRGAFKNPSEMAGAAAAGIVGPLGSSSFNLPNVERALKEMEGGTGTNPTGSADPRRGRGGVSPVSGGPNLNTGQTQHEVLQNFFQSLLSSKDRAGGGAVAPAPRQSITKTNSTSSGTDDVTG